MHKILSAARYPDVAAKATRSHMPRRLLCEPLEPRLLLSAVDWQQPLSCDGPTPNYLDVEPACACLGVGTFASSLGSETVLFDTHKVEIRVNAFSVPCMADWDQDGLLDLWIGEKTADGQGRIRVYPNSGTENQPAFEQPIYVEWQGEVLMDDAEGCLGYFPRVGDLDGDGKCDLVLGLADGRIQFFSDIVSGRLSSPLSVASESNGHFLSIGPAGNQQPMDVGARATPELADWNSDGHLDLIVGALDGQVHVFLNNIGSEILGFHEEQIVDIDGEPLIVPGMRSSPAFDELNGDGLKDLLLGNTEGELYFYANTGTASAPVFKSSIRLASANISIDLPGASRSRPSIQDFNGDGINDILVGGQDGLVRLYLGPTLTTVVNRGSQLQVVDIDGHPVDIEYDDNTVLIGAATWCSACRLFKDWIQEPIVASQIQDLRMIFAFTDESALGLGPFYDESYLDNIPGEIVIIAPESTVAPTSFPTVFDPNLDTFIDVSAFEWVQSWLDERTLATQLDAQPHGTCSTGTEIIEKIGPLSGGEDRGGGSSDPLTCSDITSLVIPDVNIASAVDVPAQGNQPRHCRVTGTIEETITFQLKLPIHNEWIGKFIMVGNGGWAGQLGTASYGLSRHYATAVTNGGHWSGSYDASWALDNEQAQLDFGYRAVHLTAITAKEIIATYYAQDPLYSYFWGCSTGGRQALMEVERYPEDFDGLIAGAPSFDQTNLLLSFIWNQQTMFPDPNDLTAPTLPNSKLALLQDATAATCDAFDGLVDGLVSDPLNCPFDPRTAIPLCPGDVDGPDCLTSAQMIAVERIYDGPSNSYGQIYPGIPPGSEAGQGGWNLWTADGRALLNSWHGVDGPNGQYLMAETTSKYLFFGDPNYDFHDFNFETDLSATDDAALIYNATSTDLHAFEQSGGKLLIYHGLADPVISAARTAEYYEAVVDEFGSLADVQSFIRMFLFPGVYHCGGGPGPQNADVFSALEHWVEEDSAPDWLLATGGTPYRTRPVCPYPQRAVWDGVGSPYISSSFTCHGEPGDFDLDGDVDGDDLAIWENGYGTTSGSELSSGDDDGDGDVDGNDFLAWQMNFGSTIISGSGGNSSTGSAKMDSGSDASLVSAETSVDIDSPQELSFNPFKYANSSLPQPMPTSNGNTATWFDLPQFRSHDASRQFHHDLAVDAVMSGLDLLVPETDLDRVHDRTTDVTRVDFQTMLDRIWLTDRVSKRSVPLMNIHSTEVEDRSNLETALEELTFKPMVSVRRTTVPLAVG